MPLIDLLIAVACTTCGFLTLRFAWRLSRGQIRDDRYPTSRHALVGRTAKHHGRTGSIVLNTRKNRLEAAVVDSLAMSTTKTHQKLRHGGLYREGGVVVDLGAHPKPPSRDVDRQSAAVDKRRPDP